jgi:hypothetical protein
VEVMEERFWETPPNTEYDVNSSGQSTSQEPEQLAIGGWQVYLGWDVTCRRRGFLTPFLQKIIPNPQVLGII